VNLEICYENAIEMWQVEKGKWEKERASLLARVKELEASIGDMKRFNTDLANEADRLRTQLHQLDAAIVAAREALEMCACETCNGTHKFKFECQACLSGEGTCSCDRQDEEPCPQCQSAPMKEFYDKRDHALSQIQACEVRK